MEGEGSRSSATRLPKYSYYKGHNGFTDDVARTLHAGRPDARKDNPGASSTELEYIEGRMSHDMIERHRFVGDFMDLRGDHFPRCAINVYFVIHHIRNSLLTSLEEMKKSNEEGENSASLLKQIKKTRERHRDDLSRLYDFQTQDYLAEAMDQYASKDDAIIVPDIDVCPSVSCMRLALIHITRL